MDFIVNLRTFLAVARLGKDVIDLEDAGVTFGDRVVLRNITWRIAPGERTGIPNDRVYICVQRYGNISAATIPIALHDAIQEGRLERGQLVAFTAFGTGLTWAASILRY